MSWCSAKTVSVIFTLIGFALCMFAFATPYWLETFPKAPSKFVRMGLWEVCMNGYIHASDYRGKIYDGCFYAFAREFNWIRGWLFPGWFVGCQVLASLTLIFSGISLIVQLVRRSADAPSPFELGTAYAAMLCQTIAVAMFGAMSRSDWTWLMNPLWNKLGFSWACALAGAICFLVVSAGLTRERAWAEWEARYGSGAISPMYTTVKQPPPDFSTGNWKGHQSKEIPDKYDELSQNLEEYD